MEQILRILIAGGIPAAEAYATIKYIKKKKRDKVLAEKEKFKTGFTKYLIEREHADQQTAEQTVERVWKITEDSSSYLFCASHSLAMSCDSAYGAYLKVHYPYEFYLTMLKLYTEKGDLEKISAIIAEMKKYKNIKLQMGQFGQDNRDWTIDKEHNVISPNLAFIKFISQQAANELYDMKDMSFATFTDLLRYLQMESNINTRQIEKLIQMDYFRRYGKRQKLLNVMTEFFKGKNKLTKTIKSYEKRLEQIRAFEANEPDVDQPIGQILEQENELINLCISQDDNVKDNEYFIEDVDDRYGVNIKCYSMKRGTRGSMRMKKDTYAAHKVEKNNIIDINKWHKQFRSVFQNGKRVKSDEYDCWIDKFEKVV